MKIVTSLLTSFCASAVFIGSLYILCPEGKISKSVKYVLSLAFLLSIIAAAGITLKNADIEMPVAKVSLEEADELDIASARFVYSSALKGAGLTFEKIEIETDKSSDGGIYISKVYIKSSEQRDKIISALGQVTGKIKVEIEND